MSNKQQERQKADMPVKPSGFADIMAASQQQTQLVFWIAQKLEEHDNKLKAPT